MNRIDWREFLPSLIGLTLLSVAGAATLLHIQRADEPPHTCPVSIPTTPSTGPVSVEWTHGDGKVTVQLGGAGFPVVADPASGKKWILMQVKED
jgi:hypothetical protein